MLTVRGQLLALAAFLISITGFATISYGHALQPSGLFSDSSVFEV